MGRLKIIISIMLLLAVGFLFGAIGSRMLIKHRIEKHFLADEPPGVQFFNRITNRLDLATSQEATIKKIIEQSREKLLVYRQKYRPEFQQLFDETLIKIKAELNESQKRKLDRYAKRIKRRGRRFRHRPPLPPPVHPLTPEEVIEELDIDIALQKDVTELLATHQAEKETVEKTFREERRQMMHQHQSEMKNLDRKIEDQLKVYLSDEQLMRFKQLLNDGKRP